MTDKITTEQLKEFLGVQDKYDTFNALEKYWDGWEGWQCRVDGCMEVVGLDTGEMFEHMKEHTIKELESVYDED